LHVAIATGCNVIGRHNSLTWNLETEIVTSGVRRKFPRGGQSFVTIVWRHKSTLGEVPKARPFYRIRGHAPGKILQNYT